MDESSGGQGPGEETPGRLGRRRFLAGGLTGFFAGLVSRGRAAQAQAGAPFLRLGTTDNKATTPTGLSRQGTDNVPGFQVTNQTGTTFVSSSPSGTAILGFSGGGTDAETDAVRLAELAGLEKEIGGLFRSASGTAILGFSGGTADGGSEVVRLSEQEYGALLLSGNISADQISSTTGATSSALLAATSQSDRIGAQVGHLGEDIALDVFRGKTRLATVGSGVIMAGHNMHMVVDQRVGARSHVMATLMSNPVNVFLVWIQRVPPGFIIHLSGLAPLNIDFSYVSLEEPEPGAHPPPLPG